MKVNYHFSFYLREKPKVDVVIGPTDRGWIRLRKIAILLKKSRCTRKVLIRFDLNFHAKRIYVIHLINQNYIYDVTTILARIMCREGQDLAVLINPIPFILPSESLKRAISRIIRLSLIKTRKSKEEIEACIEEVFPGSSESDCSQIPIKLLNTKILEVLNTLQISTVIIQLDIHSKYFPDTEKFKGNIILFDETMSKVQSESNLIQVSEWA